MQGYNRLAILGPELEVPSYLDDGGHPLSAKKMIMLYNYIDHYMEKGVRKEDTDKRLFDKFTKLLKNKYGCFLAYCCVPELRQEWQKDYQP
ncbi:hypothetical protein MMC26_001517 [Xylographa opegraphella]|nr:hypothetical protein [Xylographa opegraphella]